MPLFAQCENPKSRNRLGDVNDGETCYLSLYEYLHLNSL
jgi:predicted homoserine dehydrogenase-like protein